MWRAEESNEIRRLIDVTATMDRMDFREKPKNRRASYYNPQCSCKLNQLGILIRRVRGTYGGDVSDYAGNRSSWTADMQTIKLLLNAVVSEDANFCTADIGDFYLGSTPSRKNTCGCHETKYRPTLSHNMATESAGVKTRPWCAL